MNERHQTPEGTTRSQLAKALNAACVRVVVYPDLWDELADAALEALGWDEAPTVLVEGRPGSDIRDWEHTIIFYHPTRQGGRYKLIRVDE